MGRPAKALIAVTRSVGSNPTLSATTGVLDECVGHMTEKVVIPDADARALREQGVAEIFGPGSSLKAIGQWLEQALDDRDID